MPVEPIYTVEIAIEPKSGADRDRLGGALAEMAAGDPSFSVLTEHESGQTILRGQDEMHLDAKVEFLRAQYGVEANTGVPQVAYRESLGRTMVIDYTHKKHAGGTGQFARVKITFSPGEPGSGFVFESRIGNGAMPKDFVLGVERGIRSAKGDGLVAGYPVIDFRASFVDGAYHDVDSSVLAFEIAARAAFRDLRDKAAPRLLEPIMTVEVVTPGDCLDAVIGDLKSRRGAMLGAETRGDVQMVTAYVPVANMFGYINTLRALSRGRASFSMQYHHYAPVPLPDDDPPTFRPAIGMRA